MPWSEKFEHVLQGRAHGWDPKNKKIRKIGPEKAREMLEESKGKKTAARRKALKAIMK